VVNALVCGTSIHGFNSHYPPQFSIMSVSIQKSFLIENKSLFLIATPIGNLQELTPRALDILNTSDLLICENTFSCLRLLRHFKIERKKIIVYDNIKEKSEYSISRIINEMLNHEKIALVSNAGYPLVSDPGRVLVRKWIDMGHYVVPISGSSAFLNALVASGFYYHNFTFIGFLPRSKNKQQKFLKVYSNNFISALIIYETGNRLVKTLINIRDALGNRLIAICRELTKVHEEFIRSSLDEMIEHLTSEPSDLKGEVVIIVSVENGDNLLEKISSLRKARKFKVKQL
jgi:16S rRNA (cytidine1402-2'-O)-methyltransferase